MRKEEEKQRSSNLLLFKLLLLIQIQIKIRTSRGVIKGERKNNWENRVKM